MVAHFEENFNSGYSHEIAASNKGRPLSLRLGMILINTQGIN